MTTELAGIVGTDRTPGLCYRVRVTPDDGGPAIEFTRGISRRWPRNEDHPLRMEAHNEGVKIRNERFGGCAMVETRRID